MLITNISLIENPLQKVLNLRGVEFIWRTEGIGGTIISEGGRKDIGVIAQEIKEVLPELLIGDGIRGYAVRYQEMISVLFEAIKEQGTILDEKDRELLELESKFKK